MILLPSFNELTLIHTGYLHGSLDVVWLDALVLNEYNIGVDGDFRLSVSILNMHMHR